MVNDQYAQHKQHIKYLNTSNLVYHRKIRVPVFLSEQMGNPECCLCVSAPKVLLPNLRYWQLLMPCLWRINWDSYVAHDSHLDPTWVKNIARLIESFCYSWPVGDWVPLQRFCWGLTLCSRCLLSSCFEWQLQGGSALVAVCKRSLLGYIALKSVKGTSGSRRQNGKQGHLQIRYL